MVVTNKHPLRRATFTDRLERFHDPDFIDWDVMFDSYFTSQTDTERPERRHAEELSHRQVPLDAFLGLAARSDAELHAARQCLAGALPDWHFKVRSDWYFGEQRPSSRKG